jgi:hypothetical protein
LSDLTDVNTSTPTNRNVLVADGTDWESRALVEADISDLGTYLENIVEDTTPQLGGNLDMNGFTIAGIAEANFLDKTAAETISGVYTFTAKPVFATHVDLGSNRIQMDNNWEAYNNGLSYVVAIQSTGGAEFQLVADGVSHANTLGYIGGKEILTDPDLFAKLADNETVSGQYTFTSPPGSTIIAGGTGFYLRTTANWTSGTLNGPFILWQENDERDLAGIRAVTTDGANSFLDLGTGFFNRKLRLASTGAHVLTGSFDVSSDLTVGGDLFPGNQTIGYITAVTGNFGSIQVNGADGSSGTWIGYSNNGRSVFMDNNAGTSGIYDDTNNEWHIQCVQNLQVTLYYNGVSEFATRDSNATGNTSGAHVKDHTQTFRDVGFNTLSNWDRDWETPL